MSPKAEGKNYYKQDSPSKRGYKQRGFFLHESELADFQADVEASGKGTTGAYLRHLWNEDRRRRGLPTKDEQ